MSLHIQLDQFEGPLGLLLYLIRKEEMDIYNIRIHRITQQYLEHIKVIKDLDLESAGEFVAMAATLIHIKSKMLLPQYNEHGEVVEVEDPRKELVQRLLEYQKFQEVSKQLYERPLLGRDLWARGSREEIAEDDSEVSIEESGLFSLIAAYRMISKKMSRRVHTVMAKGQSIAARIMEIKERLVLGRRIELKELILREEYSRNKLLITFLSLLELGRLGFVSLFQSEAYADLYVEVKKPIERDIVARVDEFEAKTEGVAEQWIANAQAEEDEAPSLDPALAPAQMDLDQKILEADVSGEKPLSLENLSRMSFEEMSQVAGQIAREAAEVFEQDADLIEAERALDLQDQVEASPQETEELPEIVAVSEESLEAVQPELLGAPAASLEDQDLSPAEMLEELIAIDAELPSENHSSSISQTQEERFDNQDHTESNKEVL